MKPLKTTETAALFMPGLRWCYTTAIAIKCLQMELECAISAGAIQEIELQSFSAGFCLSESIKVTDRAPPIDLSISPVDAFDLL